MKAIIESEWTYVFLGFLLFLVIIASSGDCSPYQKKRDECALLLKMGKIKEYKECSKQAEAIK